MNGRAARACQRLQHARSGEGPDLPPGETPPAAGRRGRRPVPDATVGTPPAASRAGCGLRLRSPDRPATVAAPAHRARRRGSGPEPPPAPRSPTGRSGPDRDRRGRGRRPEARSPSRPNARSPCGEPASARRPGPPPVPARFPGPPAPRCHRCHCRRRLRRSGADIRRPCGQGRSRRAGDRGFGAIRRRRPHRNRPWPC